MMRGVMIRVLPVVFIALVLIWLVSPPVRLPARFNPADCRKVALIDPETGDPIIGPEDIALVPNSGRLIISAHDRLASDDVDGGLYSATVFDLQARGSFKPKRLTGLKEKWTPFRPHGIAVSDDGRIAVINRAGAGTATIDIARLDGNRLQRLTRFEGPQLCRANDLIFAGGAGGPDTLVATIDRGSCGFSVRDLIPFAGGTGSVIELTPGRYPRVLMTGLSFANGLLEIDGELVISETRADRLYRLSGPISLPGGPDNLSLAQGRKIIAAVHPVLYQLALYRYGGASRAPSRILAIDADRPGQPAEVLFDDPAGKIYSGATSAVLSDGVLVAGSVRESALLVCAKRTG